MHVIDELCRLFTPPYCTAPAPALWRLVLRRLFFCRSSVSPRCCVTCLLACFGKRWKADRRDAAAVPQELRERGPSLLLQSVHGSLFTCRVRVLRTSYASYCIHHVHLSLRITLMVHGNERHASRMMCCACHADRLMFRDGLPEPLVTVLSDHPPRQ